MTQEATENKILTKNRKESLKNLRYQSQVTTEEACSQREMFVGTASKLTRDLVALQKYSANFAVFLNKDEIKLVFTSRFLSFRTTFSQASNSMTFSEVKMARSTLDIFGELSCGKPLPNTDLKRAKI